MSADTGPVDLWGEVVGQQEAVKQLHSSLTAPVHAFLLVGPEGSGRRAAAMAFAADLLADGLEDDGVKRARRLVAASAHPSLMIVEPQGQKFLTDDATRIVGGVLSDKSRVEGLVWRKPPEGDRQVFLLPQLVPADASAFTKLLKAVEEPPPGTFFVIVATSVPAEMAAIASRCFRVDFTAVPEHLIAQRLESEGIHAEQARVAAGGAGGSLSRARLLARDPEAAERREAWYNAPDRLNGTGFAAAVVADELLGLVDGLVEPLAELHAEEAAAYLEGFERVEMKPRKGDLTTMEARHKREQKKVRVDELRSGLATLVSRYRDELAGGGSVAGFLAAADAVQELCDSLAFNPNEGLQLRALLVGLPPIGR